MCERRQVCEHVHVYVCVLEHIHTRVHEQVGECVYTYFYMYLLSRTKKTVIFVVIIVKSVMWAEGWERGERGEIQRVGQLLPDRGPKWMGIQFLQGVQ